MKAAALNAPGVEAFNPMGRFSAKAMQPYPDPAKLLAARVQRVAGHKAESDEAWWAETRRMIDRAYPRWLRRRGFQVNGFGALDFRRRDG